MIWCLMVVVIIHAYIGTLMSFISFPKWDPIIFKLEDVPKSNLDWYVRRGTDLESLFLVLPNLSTDIIFFNHIKFRMQKEERTK